MSITTRVILFVFTGSLSAYISRVNEEIKYFTVELLDLPPHTDNVTDNLQVWIPLYNLCLM